MSRLPGRLLIRCGCYCPDCHAEAVLWPKHPLHGEETLRHKTAQGDKPNRMPTRTGILLIGSAVRWSDVTAQTVMLRPFCGRSIRCTARRPFATKRLRVTNLTRCLPEQGFFQENDTKAE